MERLAGGGGRKVERLWNSRSVEFVKKNIPCAFFSKTEGKKQAWKIQGTGDSRSPDVCNVQSSCGQHQGGWKVGSSLTKRCFNLGKSFSSIGRDDGPATEPRAFNAAFDRLNRTTWHNLCAACGVLLYRARGNGYVAASIAGFDFIGITGSGPIMMERYLPRWISTIYAFPRGGREREKGILETVLCKLTLSSRFIYIKIGPSLGMAAQIFRINSGK